MIYLPRTIAPIFASTALFVCMDGTAQTPAPDISSPQCSLEALKVSKAQKLKLSRWGSAAGTPFGGAWTDIVDNPSQGRDWAVISGRLACKQGFPLEGTKLLDDAGKVFPVVAYSGECADVTKGEFTVIENSPGHGRTDGQRMVWAVMPSKKTGARTLYLTDSAPPNIGLCLAFDVPKTSKGLQLQIGDRSSLAVPIAK